jgi:hypothetical protein
LSVNADLHYFATTPPEFPGTDAQKKVAKQEEKHARTALYCDRGDPGCLQCQFFWTERQD